MLKSLNLLMVQVQVTHVKKAVQLAQRLFSKKILHGIQPNYSYSTQGKKGDPFAKRQFGCLPLDRLRALQRACRNREVDVAILDTGVDITHEDLNPSKITMKDFTHEDFGRFLSDIHGTAVCGIISAVPGNGRGIVGIAPFARIHVLKVCRSLSLSSIQATTDTFTLAAGLDDIIRKHYPLVNISIGGPRDKIIERLVRLACQRGTIIVAAIGNGGPRAPPAYPAAYPEVIGVTALDHNLTL